MAIEEGVKSEGSSKSCPHNPRVLSSCPTLLLFQAEDMVKRKGGDHPTTRQDTQQGPVPAQGQSEERHDARPSKVLCVREDPQVSAHIAASLQMVAVSGSQRFPWLV